MSTAIYWFRNDLRLSDNPNWEQALAEHEHIIPVYVLDSAWQVDDPLGFPRMGAFRERFLKESLLDLRAQLEDIGLTLIYREGDPVSTLQEIGEQAGVKRVHFCAEVCTQELDQEDALSKVFDLTCDYSQLLIHPEEMPMAVEDVPRVFTKWRHKVEKHLRVRALASTPEYKGDRPTLEPGEISLPDVEVDERSAFVLKGGEHAGLARIAHYLWGTDAIASYKQTRNGLMGERFSGKFSAHLALGCISPRQIYHEVSRYEQEREKNDSTYWMIFELLWRDFFKYVAMKHDAGIFQLAGIQRQNETPEFVQNHKAFELWCNGRLKEPFVDANMRELALTGWMSNRGRQNVASYLCHDLKVDWRWGARWFESQLMDYDASSNWCNWMYLASVGNDPRSRRFNIARQAQMYDGDQSYRRLWLPS